MIDAHAFLYFGDGQSVKFHSGRYKPDGGALMIGKAGIEGWWSAPDLKTDVTERASGNGAHDVSVDSILYATRTVTVHFDAIGDVHSEVLDAVTKVSQANGMPVRLRVVDDKSDTFVSGFIRPQFGPGWNERHQTGTLTIVCPRPERLAWSPLQSQLFPVSAVQGGLRYSTTPELVSAWTGTADASTSTLSQDSAVVATNLVTDPAWYAHTPRAWQAKITKNGAFWDVVKNGDRTTVYPIGQKEALSALTANTDYVVVAQVLGQVSVAHTFEQAKGISNYSVEIVGDYVVWQVHVDTLDIDNLFFPLDLIDASIKMGVVGVFTLAGWNTMQPLGVTWFDGDSYPVPMGKGLSYPLKYGTAGSSSNVALLLNNGSSKAFPVLTVTGNFPNGVQVQWGGNALQYDGAVGGVPLILDSRSQTASMGGVDVSRNLSRRDFPMVPAAGSVSLRLMSAGTGWVTAVCRDTYI